MHAYPSIDTYILHIYICIYVYIYMHIVMYICLCESACTCVYIYMYIYGHIRVYIYITYTYIYITYTQVYTYVYIHICTPACMFYTYMYMYSPDGGCTCPGACVHCQHSHSLSGPTGAARFWPVGTLASLNALCDSASAGIVYVRLAFLHESFHLTISSPMLLPWELRSLQA